MVLHRVLQALAFSWISLSISGLQQPHHHHLTSTRRSVLQRTSGWILTTATIANTTPAPSHAAASSSFADLLAQIEQAQKQLEKVPPFIEKGKWDSVRAILIEPPLADCWTKTNRPLVTKYAEELGNLGGDELAALEAREELISHLRYLDAAVYSNNFNPIATEGETGATKELVRSYYEDPINEFKASNAALQELIALAKDL